MASQTTIWANPSAAASGRNVRYFSRKAPWLYARRIAAVGRAILLSDKPLAWYSGVKLADAEAWHTAVARLTLMLSVRRSDLPLITAEVGPTARASSRARGAAAGAWREHAGPAQRILAALCRLNSLRHRAGAHQREREPRRDATKLCEEAPPRESLLLHPDELVDQPGSHVLHLLAHAVRFDRARQAGSESFMIGVHAVIWRWPKPPSASWSSRSEFVTARNVTRASVSVT